MALAVFLFTYFFLVGLKLPIVKLDRTGAAIVGAELMVALGEVKLSSIGADKSAAQLWFDLAALLESVGLVEAATDAYRRAAASTGLRARTTAPAATRELMS